MTSIISDYADLALTREQLARSVNALISLHEQLYAKNPRNYALYAAGDIDMILQLRAEIYAFLHIAPEMSASDDTVAPDVVAEMPQSPS